MTTLDTVERPTQDLLGDVVVWKIAKITAGSGKSSRSCCPVQRRLTKRLGSSLGRRSTGSVQDATPMAAHRRWSTVICAYPTKATMSWCGRRVCRHSSVQLTPYPDARWPVLRYH